jgi:hypothetical protein
MSAYASENLQISDISSFNYQSRQSIHFMASVKSFKRQYKRFNTQIKYRNSKMILRRKTPLNAGKRYTVSNVCFLAKLMRGAFLQSSQLECESEYRLFTGRCSRRDY